MTIAIGYCDLYGANARNEWLDVFGLNDLYNTSGANDDGYGDFTNLTANVSLGTSYTATFSAAYEGKINKEYWTIWIDFNIDGVFISDEIVMQGTASGSVIYTKKQLLFHQQQL